MRLTQAFVVYTAPWLPLQILGSVSGQLQDQGASMMGLAGSFQRQVPSSLPVGPSHDHRMRRTSYLIRLSLLPVLTMSCKTSQFRPPKMLTTPMWMQKKALREPEQLKTTGEICMIKNLVTCMGAATLLVS